MKKLSIISSLLIAFILIANYAYATVSANIVATASKPSLKQGEEFTVSVYLDNLNYTNKGVDEVELKIDINKDVLNELSVDSIVTKNGNVTIGDNTLKVEDVREATDDQIVFSSLTSDCDYKIFIDMKAPITTTKTKLLDLKFKVKNTVADTYIGTNIEDAISISADIITQVTAADLNNGITADTGKATMAKVPVLITAEKAEDNTNTNEEKNTNTNTGTNTNGNTNAGTNTNGNTNAGTNTNRNTNAGTNTNGNTNAGTNTNRNTNAGTNTNGNTNTGTNTNGSTNVGTNGNAGSVGGSSGSTNPNTASGVLPAAGFKLFILPVVIVGGILIYSYKKYSEYKMIK